MIKRYLVHLYPKTFSKPAVHGTLLMGGLITALFISLCITGVLLLFYYSPESSSAYSSIIYLEEKVFGGRFIRAMHLWSSHILLITLALHMIRTIFTGTYAVRASNWKLGYILFGLLVFEAYTGVLLPMDQLSYWATKTGMELVNVIPFGEFIRRLLTPDDVGGRLTLIRFFAMHIALIPLLCVFLMSAHLYNVRRDGGLHPPMNSIKTKSDPYLFNLTWLIAAAAVLIPAAFAVFSGAPLEEPADPVLPPNPAKSAWFLLWIQEIVSWKAWLFNPFAVLFILFFFLPDFRRNYKPERTEWFSKKDIPVWGITLFMCAAVIALTAVAMFFRGENWSLVPFYF